MNTRAGRFLLAASLLLCGCRTPAVPATIEVVRSAEPPGPPPPVLPPSTPVVAPLRVKLDGALTDSARRSLGMGAIVVVAREARQPDRLVQGLTITIYDSTHVRVRANSTDASGVVRLDSVRVGRYRVLVDRIGYLRRATTVDVVAGCTITVEAYLAMLMVGIETVVVTTVPWRAHWWQLWRPRAPAATPSTTPPPIPPPNPTQDGRMTVTSCTAS
jgi:hypothetical protein